MTEERTAMFVPDPTSDRYLPANKNANAACSVLSSMRLTQKQLLAVRQLGFTPRLLNGQEIGRVDVRA